MTHDSTAAPAVRARGGTAPAPPLEAVADEIASLVRGSELRCAVAVGRLVVERVLGGDLARWRRHGPRDRSLAELASILRARGVCSPSALSRCLATYEVVERCRDVAASQRLSPSHVHAVLPLAAGDQERLLREADARGWSVADLRARVAEARTHSGRGRPRLPAFVKAVTGLRKAADRVRRSVEDEPGLAMLDPDEHEHAVQAFAEVLESLERQFSKATPKRLRTLRRLLRGAWGRGLAQAPGYAPAAAPGVPATAT